MLDFPGRNESVQSHGRKCFFKICFSSKTVMLTGAVMIIYVFLNNM